MMIVEARTPAIGTLIKWGPLSSRQTLAEIARLRSQGFKDIIVRDEASGAVLTIAAVTKLASEAIDQEGRVREVRCSWSWRATIGKPEGR